MAHYKHACIYCNKLIEADSEFCPYCSSPDPFVLRCPMCRNPVEKDYVKCNKCGFDLYIKCPECGRKTFASIGCSHCNAEIMIKCPNPKCGLLQLKSNEKCIRCNKDLLKKKGGWRWR